MKVTIDYELCLGHGMCEAVAGELFTVSAAGTAVALKREIPADFEELAASAVAACPAMALRIQTQP